MWSLDERRELAKLGMVGAMVATVGSAFFLKNRSMRRLHVGAGAALVGFSLWHHYLYNPKKETAQLKEKATIEEQES